jgi:hypothetical protein
MASAALVASGSLRLPCQASPLFRPRRFVAAALGCGSRFGQWLRDDLLGSGWAVDCSVGGDLAATIRSAMHCCAFSNCRSSCHSTGLVAHIETPISAWFDVIPVIVLSTVRLWAKARLRRCCRCRDRFRLLTGGWLPQKRQNVALMHHLNGEMIKTACGYRTNQAEVPGASGSMQPARNPTRGAGSHAESGAFYYLVTA